MKKGKIITIIIIIVAILAASSPFIGDFVVNRQTIGKVKALINEGKLDEAVKQNLYLPEDKRISVNDAKIEAVYADASARLEEGKFLEAHMLFKLYCDEVEYKDTAEKVKMCESASDNQGDYDNGVEYYNAGEYEKAYLAFKNANINDSQEYIAKILEKMPYLGITNDVIYFGRYEQDGNTANGPEPLKWHIETCTNDDKALYCLSVIDVLPYNQSGNATTFKDSSLSRYLNTEFYNKAFNDEEKEIINQKIVTSRDTVYIPWDNFTAEGVKLNVSEVAKNKGVEMAGDAPCYWIVNKENTSQSSVVSGATTVMKSNNSAGIGVVPAVTINTEKLNDKKWNYTCEVCGKLRFDECYYCEKTKEIVKPYFSNSEGTFVTVCAEDECENYITSSGASLYCGMHSKPCKECGQYMPLGIAEYCGAPCKPPANSDATCAEVGCDRTVAPGGATVYCSYHSNICGNCGTYIDGDAVFCMDCIASALKN